jgi:hypothetical protein
VGAVLERAAAGWRGIASTPADARLLRMIRRDLGLARGNDTRPGQHRSEEVTTAA